VPLAAGAQPIGPPIPPELVIRQQAAPLALPPPPVGANPSGAAAPVLSVPGQTSTGRVAACQHQAAVERVPRRQRASYVHTCAFGD
jgi:hypothetical protein